MFFKNHSISSSNVFSFSSDADSLFSSSAFSLSFSVSLLLLSVSLVFSVVSVDSFCSNVSIFVFKLLFSFANEFFFITLETDTTNIIINNTSINILNLFFMLSSFINQDTLLGLQIHPIHQTSLQSANAHQ